MSPQVRCTVTVATRRHQLGKNPLGLVSLEKQKADRCPCFNQFSRLILSVLFRCPRGVPSLVHIIQCLYSTKARETCANFDAYRVRVFQTYATNGTDFTNAAHSSRVDGVIRLVFLDVQSHAEALEFIPWQVKFEELIFCTFSHSLYAVTHDFLLLIIILLNIPNHHEKGRSRAVWITFDYVKFFCRSLKARHTITS